MHSRRGLARVLEAVGDFESPSAALEQYRTPPDLAAYLVHTASMLGDIDSRTVVDLGAGTGMLSIGASFVEPNRVVGIDVDKDALLSAVANERRITPPVAIEWVEADVASPGICVSGTTVLSNPPFGAQRGSRHADRTFLETIAEIARVSYTVHNRGSENFIRSFAHDRDARVTHAFEAEIPLEHRFSFHREHQRDLPVEVYRIEWGQPSAKR